MSARIKVSGNVLAILAGAVAASPALPAAAGEEGTQQEGLPAVARSVVNNFVPDYLMERVEVELSHRIINGYYPRLGLTPGQRFASKGSYLVRFVGPEGKRVVVDGDWIVP